MESAAELWVPALAFTVSVAVFSYLWNVGRRVSKREIRGKAVFVTGCDSGIGFECAKHFHSLGFHVFAGCLFPDKATALQRLGTELGRLDVVHLDVTDHESVKKASDYVKEKLRQTQKEFWALVNNAGILVFGDFLWSTWDQCQNQIDINLKGTIRITKIFLPLIRKHKARILTVTSVNGRVSYPGCCVYSATKHGLEGFLNALRIELLSSGVHVVTMELGDFGSLTNIMKRQEEYARSMWDEMGEDERTEFQDVFWSYHIMALRRRWISGPVNYRESLLFSHFTDAILSRHPKTRYVTAGYFMWCVLFLFRIIPTFLYCKMMSALYRFAFSLSPSTRANY